MKKMPSTTTIGLILDRTDVTNSVKTFQLSKRYAKKFVKLGTFNIIYRRIEIPDSEIVKQKYEKIPYANYKRKSTNYFIRNYHAFIIGIMDAIEKDYLQEVFMYMYNKKNKQIVETYNFKIKYNKDTEATSTVKSPQVKTATTEFLQCLADLPAKKLSSDEIELSLECTYNDDVPPEYEPPHFESTSNPLCMSLEINPKITILGKVNTGFHKISCFGRGKIFSVSRASTPAPSVYDVTEEEQMTEDTANEKGTQNENNNRSGDEHDEDLDDTAFSSDEIPRKRQKVGSEIIDITDDTCASGTVASHEELLTCHCELDLPKEFETIRCIECYGIVHITCHGYLSLNTINVDTFKCSACQGPLDSGLKNLSKLRIIMFSMRTNKVFPDDLVKLGSSEERTYVLNQLKKLEIYNPDSKGRRNNINFAKLDASLLVVFEPENSEFFY